MGLALAVYLAVAWVVFMLILLWIASKILP
jgi:hypothetical protein